MPTPCPHCQAIQPPDRSRSYFTAPTCPACGRQYLQRPTAPVVALVYTRINGRTTQRQVTGLLRGDTAI